MGKGKPGVVVYWDTFDALDKLKPEKVKIMLKAMRNFAQYGEVPDFGDDDMLEFAWPLIEQRLVSDSERYNKIVNKKVIAGLTSNFKRNYAPKHGINPDDEEALQEYICQQMSTRVDTDQQNQPNTDTTSTTDTTSITKTERVTETATGGKPSTPAPLTLGKFNNVFLTEGELAELQAEYPGKWEAMIENLSAKIAMKGYKYENHLAAILSWEAEDSKKEADKPKSRLDWGSSTTERDYSGDQVPW